MTGIDRMMSEEKKGIPFLRKITVKKQAMEFLLEQ